MAPHSRSMLCSRFAVNFASLQTKGARECRVHGAPAVSCASPTKENAHEHTGTPKSPGIPARNGFTDYHVLSLVHGLYGHHRPRPLHREFGISVAMPGPHAFSV